jgi:hypothetical protein
MQMSALRVAGLALLISGCTTLCRKKDSIIMPPSPANMGVPSATT